MKKYSVLSYGTKFASTVNSVLLDCRHRWKNLGWNGAKIVTRGVFPLVGLNRPTGANTFGQTVRTGACLLGPHHRIPDCDYLIYGISVHSSVALFSVCS